MKAKLTLSVDEELVEYAHRQAEQTGQSVSKMFSTFLLDKKRRANRRAIPSVDDMVGSLRGHNIDDSKAGIREAYAQKYLR